MNIFYKMPNDLSALISIFEYLDIKSLLRFKVSSKFEQLTIYDTKKTIENYFKKHISKGKTLSLAKLNSTFGIPFITACKKGELPIVKKYIKLWENGDVPLIKMSWYDEFNGQCCEYTSSVKEIITQVSPSDKYFGASGLEVSILNNHQELTDYLIDILCKGASNLEIKYYKEFPLSTPFIAACSEGNINDVKKFVEIDNNIINKFGYDQYTEEHQSQYRYTGLMMACEQYHKEIIKYLLEHNADPTLKNHIGWNSLHSICDCIECEDIELIQMLLNHMTPYSINNTDYDEQTPLDVLFNTGCKMNEKKMMISELICSYGGKRQQQLV
jgi:ankyrin repeat protein